MLRLFSPDARRGMIGRIRQIAGASAARAGFADASCSRISIDPSKATTLDVDLRAAGLFDREEALILLEKTGLQSIGLAEHFPSGYAVARDPKTGALAGLVGIERHGDDGMLRVVAVHPSFRGAGLARALVLAAMDLAGVVGLRDLYVLSRIAPQAFARMGWKKISREDLPAELEVVDAVREMDPSSATILCWGIA